MVDVFDGLMHYPVNRDTKSAVPRIMNMKKPMSEPLYLAVRVS